MFVPMLMAEPSPTPSPDKLHDAMADFVTQITKTLADTKSFTAEQAPEVLAQYMAYQVFSLHVWIYVLMSTSLITLIIAVIMWIDPEDTGGVAMSATIVFFVMIYFIVANYMEITKIKIAPKVYAIEYAKSLIGH